MSISKCMSQCPTSLLAISCLLSINGLSADERAPHVRSVESGVQLTLVAEHPQLATPTGIDVDLHGRVWVVATHTHFRPEDYVGPEHDEVLVFSDDDGDGRFERRQVFYHATDATMDLELGEDGWIYLAERDRILRIKDTDGDGTADLEEDIAVLDSEADYPHNGLSGLTWHPDGDLGFSLGENFATPWKLTGSDGITFEGIGEGGIFRCKPAGSELSRIAYGFWNPFGVCVRSDGEIFAVENDPGERPPCRLLHIVQGGDYGYQRLYGPEAHHPFVGWNGELRGTLPMIHPSGEAPCGVAPVGQGLLVPSWSDHRIDFFRLEPEGATFKAERIALVKGERYFRPTCIARDPASDGNIRAWYLADWVDGRYEAHGYGRLWRLEIDLEAADWVGPLDLEPPTAAAQLAEGLRSGTISKNRKVLFQLAQGDDPFVARAALLALAREAPHWLVEDVSNWSAGNRVQALLALKLADVSPEVWAQGFLNDPDADVQFEALRWIADKELTSLLSEVTRFSERKDLDYRRFEATIATLNRLQGQPEAGIRNPEILLARVRDSHSAPRLRAYALRLLPTIPRSAPKAGGLPVQHLPKGLSLELLRQLLELNDNALSLEAIHTLVGNPGATQDMLIEVASDSGRDSLLRAEAIAGLAAVADQHRPWLLKLVDDPDLAVREEALRSLRMGELSSDETQMLSQLAERHPESSDLFKALLNPESLIKDRPAPTDVDAWLAAMESVAAPTQVENGRRIFFHSKLALCANCHRHSGRGNVVGPDLSSIGDRGDRSWLLGSILDPSREIAPQYQRRMLLLKDGRTFTGIRLRSSTREAMRDEHGQNRTFDRDDIESMVELSTSFMPNELINSLTTRELRDLLAFLESSSGWQ